MIVLRNDPFSLLLDNYCCFSNIIFANLPVNDMVRVAVVDALKNLFHEDGRIFLSEFASGNDLIEQLSTFANSKA